MDTPCSTFPHLLIAYVQCTNQHRLPGLFVLLRPLAQKSTTLLESLFGDVERSFTLGMVDSGGYLQLFDTSSDPWPSYYKGDYPHALKILADHPYEFYFIRHPDVSYAHQALQELNEERDRRITKNWKPSTKSFTFGTRHLVGDETIDELVLTLDESPDSYYPEGSDRYGNWVLYRDMPHGDCCPVRKEVEKLQRDLGALRYVVGDDTPYVPEAEKKKGKRVLNPDTINLGIFDSRTLNAVYVFQKDASEGKAFQVNDRSRPIAKAGGDEDPSSSRAFLDGGPAPQSPESLTADGVVDSLTGNAIARWNQQGLRNPGHILICLLAREGNAKWKVWFRQEAAERLYAWRELTKALGFSKSIAANHTYRSAVVDVGHAPYGKSAVSIHKTGLAIDLGLTGDYCKAVPEWPIVITRDEESRVEKKNRKGEVEGYRVKFRLFAVSELPVDREEGLKQCRKNLEKVKAAAESHPQGAILERVASRLLAQDIEGGDFVETYFKEEIQEWNYDAYDPDGGEPGDVIKASEKRAQQLQQLADEKALLAEEAATLEDRLDELNQVPAAKQDRQWRKEKAAKTKARDDLNERISAKQREEDALSKQACRFLDLTALAEHKELGLERIGSFTNKYEPTGLDWGLAAKAISTGNFKTLAAALDKLKREHPALAVKIQDKVVTIGDIDTDFMVKWAASLAELKLCRDANPRASCVLSREKAADKRVAQICPVLREFSDKTFQRTQTDELKTGEEWATEIEAKLLEIKSAAPPNLKDSSKASAKKEKSLWTYTLLPTFGTSGEEPIVFLPGKTIYVPDAGAPIGMEWWHYQVGNCIRGKNFGTLLKDLGWTDETAGDKRVASLYHRQGAGYPEPDLGQVVG